jgi:phosphoribosylglycinamide formyltransferase-1
MTRIAVLVSGQGTILEAIFEAGIGVELVVADRDCPALQIAKNREVYTELVERRSFGSDFNRDFYSRELMINLRQYQIELVVMAGFKTILSPVFFHHFPGEVLNTHPSLLPAFPGPHAVRDALEYGVKVTGCTVHIATEKVDAGKILAQQTVWVKPDDTEESLHEEIKQIERWLYPKTIKEFLQTLEASSK